MGDAGKDECPDGYKEIFDGSVCEMASYYLGLTYHERNNVNTSRSICYWCGGCSPKITKVSNDHGSLAKWICQKGMYHKFSLIPELYDLKFLVMNLHKNKTPY